MFISQTTVVNSQTLTSNQSDYYPGEIAIFSGSGFQPNEIVDLVVLHHDETPNTGENHEHWNAFTDEFGNFTTTWIVCTDDCLGSTLRAYAVGLSSNLQAFVEFTDANSSINLISPANAFQGDNINLIAKLTSNPGNVNVANKIIKFYLNNVLLGQNTTNSSGEAAFNFTCTQGIGTYNGNNGLKAVFDGDPSNNPYAGSSKFNNFEIKAPLCTTPVISCPSNIIENSEASSCGKSISFIATATGTNPTIIYKIGSLEINSTHSFPIGTTTVTATATNSCGNSSCTFDVTVNDTTPPIAPTLENVTGECGAEVPTPTANDNC
ncbi:MAG: HYR domain-containing protein, partial [Bacteroidota bacterium]